MSVKYWGELFDVSIPLGLNPCRFCKGECMKAEGVEDRDGKGKVIRIYAMCDVSTNECKDDIRTEFATEKEAVKEWNLMNSNSGAINERN